MLSSFRLEIALAFACLVSLALVVAPAEAQGNDQFAPAGGRSTLMGNTGVALARDGSAPFYNPATIVRIRDERLAFSVNFYSLELMHFSDFHQPGGLDRGVFGDGALRDSGLLVGTFRVLPSTLCLFFTLSDLAELSGAHTAEVPPERVPRSKLAMCFASLESDDVNLQATHFEGRLQGGPTSQVQSLNRTWSRTYVGPTFSTYVDPRIAIGGSLQVAYAHSAFGMNSSSLSSALDGSAIASSLGIGGSGYSFELLATLGATYRYGAMTLGASVRAPSLHVLGSYRGSFNRASAGGATVGSMDSAVVSSAQGDLRAATPIRTALGVGFEWPKLTLEVNGALDVPIDDDLTSELTVKESTSTASGVMQKRQHMRFDAPSRVTVTPGIGAEYFFRPTLSLLSGVSANFSSIARLSPVDSIGNLVQARTNHLDGALGLGSYWEGGELLFGFRLDYEWGQAIVINPYVVPNAFTTVGTRSYGVMFVISGATDLRAIMRVVHTITTGGAPPPPPAIEPPPP